MVEEGRYDLLPGGEREGTMRQALGDRDCLRRFDPSNGALRDASLGGQLCDRQTGQRSLQQ
jgi:hypothetical protein